MPRIDLSSRRPAWALAALLLAVTLAGCGQGTRLAPQRHPSPVVRMSGGPSHIAVLVMENEAYGAIIGNHSAPYINRLARESAVPMQMYAVRHPSLPNYLALLGGSTFGVDSDCTGCQVTGDNLAEQMQRAGISWRAYMEGLPHPCFAGAGHNRYAKKHNPFMYFTGLAGDPGLCTRVVPLSRLALDERARTLPRFIWITPDLCHDMHDCDTATGDRFLAGLVPGLLSHLGPRGVLFLTFDEGTDNNGCCSLAGGGHIATIVAGRAARSGARLRTPTDHYSVLQTIQDLLRLPRLRGAACACTPSLAPLLRGVHRVVAAPGVSAR